MNVSFENVTQVDHPEDLNNVIGTGKWSGKNV